jgi:quercetin dioxygenase-like cupin family protein
MSSDAHPASVQEVVEAMEVMCQPCGTDVPTKALGPEGSGAKMYITKLQGGKTATRIHIEKGFDWRVNVKPLLPGCPDWCPATHFGYLESGQMDVLMQDGTKVTVKQGETYLIPPGHLPSVDQDTVMIEFAQEQIYTSKEFLEKQASADQKPQAETSKPTEAPAQKAEIISKPCDTDAPTKAMGPEGAGAKMYMNKLSDGRTATRIVLEKGFDWLANVKPILPGCPDWCPATHFGYLESGEMTVEMKDGTKKTVKAGETYLIPPGHLPTLNEKAVMVEFAQEQIYHTIAAQK